MTNWHQPYLGMTAFPKELSPFEIELFFTMDAGELVSIQTFRTPTSRLGAALQRGFLNLTGTTLGHVKKVPRGLLRHLAQQLEDPPVSIATLRSLYQDRERTLFEHRAWAISVLKFKKLEKRQNELVRRLRKEAYSALTVDALVDFAKAWNYQRKVLMPVDRDLRSLASAAFEHAEQKLAKQVRAAIPETVRKKWLKALTQQPPSGIRSYTEWLFQGPKRGVRKGLGNQFEKHQFLRTLGVHEYALAMPLEKQRFYAHQIRSRRPALIRQLAEPARTLQVACFMRTALTRATDSIVVQSGQRTLDITRHASTDARLADAARGPRYRESMARIEKICKSKEPDAEARIDQILGIATSFNREAPRSRAAAIREGLIDRSPQVRALLHDVVTKLPLRSEPDEPLAASIGVLRDLFERRTSELPEGSERLLQPLWRKDVSSPDRERARRAFEAAFMLNLRKAFRRGTVWVDDSNEFRSREQILISAQRWEKERLSLCANLGVTGTAQEYLEPLIERAKTGLARVAEAVESGELQIVGGSIKVSPLKREALPPDLDAQRRLLQDRVGEVQLPDLMMEMDSELHFSRHLLGRAPRSERELLPLYAGILASGTCTTARSVSLMTGVPESQVLVAMRGLESENPFRLTNDEAAAYVRDHPIASHWGAKRFASADMMSLEVSRHLWIARNDPRRGVPCIGVYQHLFRWSLIDHLPIVLKTRQAGMALDGILRHLDLGIEQLSVDTHGHTHFAMGIAPIFGVAICPRLQDVSERKLTIPPGIELPKALEGLVTREVSVAKITQGFDALLRVAASIREGTTSAVVAFDRFGSSAARGDAAQAAGEHLGRLQLTIFLCDYYTNPVFRRELHRVLNHVEAIHELERAIIAVRLSANRGRRPEELVALAGALTLLTNLVVAWNTKHLQHAVKELAREGTFISPEVLAHISPVSFAHINFRGLYNFLFARYASLLFGDQPVRRAVVSL